MGFLTDPSTKSVNPNSKGAQGTAKGYDTLIQQLLGSTTKAGGQNLTSDLQTSAFGGIESFLGGNAGAAGYAPEIDALNSLMPGLMNIFNTNTAEGVGQAAMPLFQQGLQFAQGSLANSGQGRFSTTFENQGIGLGQRALQDFNLLQQQAFQQHVGNQLGAGGLLSTLAGQAGQNPFSRLLQAGQLGQQATAQNPLLQLLLGGMNIGRTPNDTVVGDSLLGNLATVASIAAAIPTGGASLAALPALNTPPQSVGGSRSA